MWKHRLYHDVLAREVVKPHRKAWQEIVQYFGREVLNDDLTLNRKKLAEKVFGDEELARQPLSKGDV